MRKAFCLDPQSLRVQIGSAWKTCAAQPERYTGRRESWTERRAGAVFRAVGCIRGTGHAAGAGEL